MPDYFVKYSKNSIEPEEIFLDSGASGSKEPFEKLEFMVSPRAMRGVVLLGFLFLCFALAFSFYYQIVQRAAFTRQAEENRLRLLFHEAPRGLIFDRYGKVLAENKMVFEVLALSAELPSDDTLLQGEARKVAEILGFDANAIFLKLEGIRKKNVAEPQVVFSDIPSSSALVVKAKEAELTGIFLSSRFERVYPYGSAFSHLLGYTGKVREDELKQDPTLGPKDMVGRNGLEAFYDKFLRGEEGKTVYEVDARLESREKETEVGYLAGNNLLLSIDAEFQKVLYGSLGAAIGTRFGGGAAVALDPKTGEVLALVSFPGYDNNLFAQGISSQEFSNLTKDRQRPLFNRTVSGEYSSASTIKPLIAIAALKEKIIDPLKKIPAFGSLVVPNPYDPEKPSVFRDWRVHGFVDMREAIANSANVYFYIIGGGFRGKVEEYFVDQKGLGIENIKKYLTLFGWGKSLGIDLPGEKSGFLPDPEWKAEHNKADPTWRVGDTYITSIGQGSLLVTPLQLTVAHAVFANGGKLLKPFIVKSVVDSETNLTVQTREPEVLRTLDFSQAEMDVIREGMRLTIAAGSARRLSDLPFSVAGKTGSAQVSSSLENTNAVFVSFMPYEDPKLVLTILVEGGGEGGATAVPIAKEALRWYWEHRLQE